MAPSIWSALRFMAETKRSVQNHIMSSQWVMLRAGKKIQVPPSLWSIFIAAIEAQATECADRQPIGKVDTERVGWRSRAKKPPGRAMNTHRPWSCHMSQPRRTVAIGNGTRVCTSDKNNRPPRQRQHLLHRVSSPPQLAPSLPERARERLLWAFVQSHPAALPSGNNTILNWTFIPFNHLRSYPFAIYFSNAWARCAFLRRR